MDYGIAAPGHFTRPPEAAAIALVHATLDAGISTVDTARAYGEVKLCWAKTLQETAGGCGAGDQSKSPQPDGSLPEGAALRQHMLHALETSLRLLQTDYVDLWQIAMSTPLSWRNVN